MRQILIASIIGVFAFGGGTTSPLRAAELITVKTPRGATQAFIFIRAARPRASVILFAGGHGGLGLTGPSSMSWGRGNFLVRSRRQFAAQGFNVAVPDAPSDRGRMNAIFRMSRQHADDIAAVARYLKQQAPVPVWVIGTSMGTFSAARAAIGTPGVSGLVLTSTVTKSHRRWSIRHSHPQGVASMPLDRVRVPTLIVSHRHDECRLTPAADAPRLRAALRTARPVSILLFDGGRPPRSKPCRALSAHGFYGIEDQVVRSISGFVRANAR